MTEQGRNGKRERRVKKKKRNDPRFTFLATPLLMLTQLQSEIAVNQ